MEPVLEVAVTAFLLAMISIPIWGLLQGSSRGVRRVDLRKEGAIQSIERSQGQLRVRAIDPDAPDQGSITMIFNDNPLELNQWIVIDGQGLATTVALSDTQRNVKIDPNLFFIEDVN